MFDFCVNPQTKPVLLDVVKKTNKHNNPTLLVTRVCVRDAANCQNVAPFWLQPSTDELMHERAKNKMLQEEMEATLHDIQNM